MRYHITVTVTGRFDFFETQTVAVRATATAKPFSYGAGDPYSPLSRLLLESVSEVDATAIDATVYSKPERNISVEEANNLVYAYLTGCGKKHCPLEEYNDPDHPDFYGLEALNDNRSGNANLGFFEIDPRTGDVWNGVICEQFSSPPLLKLQRTIRHRIGLTDQEYRNARRPGPFCEPGMPRASKSKP
jgi:hypothetical protein